MDLTKEEIVTYRSGSPPLIRRDMIELLKEVPGWSLKDGQITRRYLFSNSTECLAFINDIVAFSQKEGHLPDISMKEGRIVDVSFYTYPAGGLTWNDFIMAAKMNEKDKTVPS